MRLVSFTSQNGPPEEYGSGSGVAPWTEKPYVLVRPKRSAGLSPRQSMVTEVGPVMVQWISSAARRKSARAGLARGLKAFPESSRVLSFFDHGRSYPSICHARIALSRDSTGGCGRGRAAFDALSPGGCPPGEHDPGCPAAPPSA